jgi:hypothetical protein
MSDIEVCDNPSCAICTNSANLPTSAYRYTPVIPGVGDWETES